MFSDKVGWLLFFSTWQTLTGGLAHVTTLFIYTQNLRYTLAETTLLMTGTSLVLGIYGILVAPVLDVLVSPWVTFAATLGVAAGRLLLVVQLGYFTARPVSGPLVILLPVTLMSVAALQLLAATSISLAMKRATENDQRGIGGARANAAQVGVYGVSYALDNIASGVAMAAFQGMKWTEPRAEMANLIMIAYSALASIGGVALAVHVWPVLAKNAAKHTAGQERAFGARVGDAREFLRSPALWRFIAVNLLLMFASALFLYNDIVLPYVMISHTKGGQNAPFTLVQLLNMIVVIAAAPLIQLATAHRVSNYRMLIGGTALASLSVLVVLLGDPASLWPYVVYMVLFSLAEATWAARLSAYSFSMAPRGSEATYGSLAAGPNLAGGLIVRLGVGFVGDHFCPVGATAASCNSRAIWGIAFGISLVTPLALALMTRWLDRRPYNVPDALQSE